MLLVRKPHLKKYDFPGQMIYFPPPAACLGQRKTVGHIHWWQGKPRTQDNSHALPLSDGREEEEVSGAAHWQHGARLVPGPGQFIVNSVLRPL